MAAKVILFASPVFFLLIALEFFWGRRVGRNTYRLNDAINSITLGIISQITAIFGRVLRVGMYALVLTSFSIHAQGIPAVADFWRSPLGWVLALLFYDFCYYWLHRAGHEVAIFWAAHAVHHQSQDYNLSTALRQTSTGFLLGWIFYLPMAMAGVPLEVFALVGLVDLLYQFWVHTEHVGKLGWFDRVFVSPSNHRVHHAVNDEYLDKNYGGILILWDRLFGTFKEESAPCLYGTRKPLNSWDPLWANLEVYAALFRTASKAPNWMDKVLVWFKPPGWIPKSLRTPELIAQQERFSQALLHQLAQGNKFDPRRKSRRPMLYFGLFVALLLASSAFLSSAGKLPSWQAASGCLVLCLLLWALNRRLG